MPQIGERRKGQTETVEWNGDRWTPVSGDSGSKSEMYHPGLGDTPFSAAASELGRTAKEAAIGVAHSPIDLVNSFLHPIDTLTSTAHAITHPVDTANALFDDPRAAGGVLGQLLMGKVAPDVVPAARGPVGRGIGAVGRGMEAVGSSAPARTAGGFGAMEAALRMDPKGLMVAAAPPALEYGGRGLQRLGSAIEGVTPGAKPSITPNAMSPRLAGKAPTLNDALESALQGVRDDNSPVTRTSGKLADTPDVRTSPINEFYKNDPAARSDLDGVRTTGSFQEGSGGLSDVMNGNVRRHPMPMPKSDIFDLPDAPDFTYEAGHPDIPGLTVGEAGSNPLTDRVTAAAKGLETPESADIMPFSKFSESLDPIIDAAGPEDLPQSKTGFLSRSKPTKADLAGLERLRQADRQRELVNR